MVVARPLLLLLAACAGGGPAPKDDSGGADSGTADTDSGEGDSGDSGEGDSGDSGDTALAVDADGDGFGADVDCNDGDRWTYPGAEEWCDPVDHDCDGEPLAEGVCAKVQTLEPVEDAWIGGDVTSGQVVDPQFVGDLDGVPGEELAVRTYHRASWDPETAIRSLAILSAPLPEEGASVTDVARHFIVSGPSAGLTYLHTARGVGDFNGDGHGDLVLESYDYTGDWHGRAHLLLGPSSDWPTEMYLPEAADTVWDLEGAISGEGYGIDAGGDFNGDGLADIAIASPTATLLAGRPDAAQGWRTLEGETRHELTNNGDIWFTGDLDADGLDDVAYASSISFRWISGGDIRVGEESDWTDRITHYTLSNDGECTYALGEDHTRLGDWSGDGIEDFAARCQHSESGSTHTTIHVIDGASIPIGAPDTDLFANSLGYWGTPESDEGLWSPVRGGDFDGDGLTDIVIGGGVQEDLTTYQYYIGLSTDGVPAPGTDPSARGYAIRSDYDPSGKTILFHKDTGDLDGDGYPDLAFQRTDDQEVGESISVHVVLGWDLPWHDAYYW